MSTATDSTPTTVADTTVDVSAIDHTFVTVNITDARPGWSTVETAVYKRRTDGKWQYTTRTPGEGEVVRAMVATFATGSRSIRDANHLRTGGEWMQVVPDHLMAESTTRQRVTAEIADLRAEADRRAESAGYSGEMHDGGARYLRERADGMEHVLNLLAPDHRE